MVFLITNKYKINQWITKDSFMMCDTLSECAEWDSH